MRHLATNSWKARDEFIERVIIFQILKERFHGNSCARKNRRPTENLGVNGDERICGHVGSITDSGFRVNIAEISENAVTKQVRRGEIPRPTRETRTLPRVGRNGPLRPSVNFCPALDEFFPLFLH